MKKRSLVAILLLAVMVVLSMSSCAEQDVKTTVNLTIKAGYELYKNDVTVSTAADNTNGPSVLNVLHTIMDNEDVKLEFDKNNRLIKMGNYYETDYNGVSYFWEFKINGEVPKSGTAETNYVKAGDKIEYNLMAMISNDNVVPYDNSTNVFEDILSKGNESTNTTDTPSE